MRLAATSIAILPLLLLSPVTRAAGVLPPLSVALQIEYPKTPRE
jgi:hypothetical protein